MGERYVYLRVKMRQWYCKPCNRYYSESLDFADLNKGYTHRQTDYMFCLARKQSYTEVAAIVDVSPKTIERLVLSTCQRVIDVAARYRLVRHLGIDEHSHRKGKKDYLCILTDLDRGIIIDMLPDRKKEPLLAHFKSLGEGFCNQITDVACDYWPTYLTVSQTCFPQAKIILDGWPLPSIPRHQVVKYRPGHLSQRNPKSRPRESPLQKAQVDIIQAISPPLG
jgi:transposase